MWTKKHQKIDKAIRKLHDKLAQAVAEMTRLEMQRSLFNYNDKWSRRKRNLEAHIRNIKQSIEFNRRKLEKLPN